MFCNPPPLPQKNIYELKSASFLYHPPPPSSALPASQTFCNTVCKISSELSPLISLLSTEGLHSILKQPSDLCAESNLLQSIDETGDNQELDKMVTFSHAAPLVPLPQKPATAPAHVTNGLRRSESLGPLRQVVSGQGSRGGSLHSSRSSSLHSSRSSLDLNPPSTRSLARIGRPIAQVAQIPDPVSEVGFGPCCSTWGGVGGGRNGVICFVLLCFDLLNTGRLGLANYFQPQI